MFTYKYTFVTLLCFQHAVAFNILAIIAKPILSHNMALYPLFRELARRGHNVTVINNFPREEPIPSLKFVDLQGPNVGKKIGFDFYETTNAAYLPLISLYRQLTFGPEVTRAECESLFTSDNIKKHYAAKEKYDVIFTELFTCDCGLAYAAEMYDAPIIGITSHVLMPTAYWKLGIPFNIATDSCYYSPAGTNPSIIHKVQNYVLHLSYNTLYTWRKNREIYDVFNHYVPRNNLNIQIAAKEKMKMLFAYQHFSITGARVFSSQVLEIAGTHITKPKPVPDELEKFLADAMNGAIYISFGSILEIETMSEYKLQQFLEAFNRVPYKIIWKINNITLAEVSEKFYIGSWMPQLDILCHPKVKAFVSHGGMLSMSEAANCGKPIIAIPFFGDQFSNSAAVRESGLGKTLNFYDLNADNFEKAITEVTSKEMQQSAQKVSRLWHDRPHSAMDSAIYWTEYVARHGDAPPSHPAKCNSWYADWLIDVFAMIFLILSTIVFVLYIMFKLIKMFVIKFYRSTFCRNKIKRE